jgi:hypothetical protein
MTNVGFDAALVVDADASGITAAANVPTATSAAALFQRCFMCNVLPFSMPELLP